MAEKPDKEEYKLASRLPVMKSKREPDSNILPTPVTMLTWNITGSRSEKNFAAIRGTIVPIVRQLLPTSCISFLQEISTGVGSVVRWGFGDLATSTLDSGKKEAGVSTPQSGKELIFELGDSSILDENELERLGVKAEFTNRMGGRKVTMKRKVGGSEYIGNITVISYHAPYKIEDKKEKMIEYFQTMCDLADRLGQTIIIGGDFNLSILDWKEKVEKEFPERVSAALYIGTPRRWVRDKLIDTFAIVQPKSKQHRTAESTFNETMAIYPFPMAGRVGGDKETTLQVYEWFKYVHFSDEDLEAVKKIVKEKGEGDIHKITEKIQKKNNELSKEAIKEKKEKLQKEIEELIKTKTKIEQPLLSEPFTKIKQVAPAPLWPNSPLDDVLDHDPVVTKITVFLKQNSSTQDNTSVTPRKRVARNNQ